MKVKRFTLECNEQHLYEDSWDVWSMEEDASGDFVNYEDYQQLAVQNAELVAVVERLNQTVISIKARGSLLHNITIGLLQGAELHGSDWDYISEIQVEEITQCLRDIQAEAGRAGYMECAKDNGLLYPESAAVWTNKEADEYAERVRAGKE